jgi:putative ABC transport system substrate-binding protein
MNARRRLLAGLGVALLNPWAFARARNSDNLPRIGYLVLSPISEVPSPERAGFLHGLRELGYEDGKNIVIAYRSAEGDPEALPFRVQELMDLGVKVIVTMGSPPVRAVREISHSVPIVMMGAADPVRLGFVHSLAMPGTNVTGMTAIQVELGPKRLQILKTAFPHIGHVALVMDTSNPGVEPEAAAIQAAARRMGVRISLVGLPEVTSDDALRARLDSVRADALMTVIDPRVSSYQRFLPQYTNRYRMPAMFDWRPFVETGGLMSYGPDFSEMARRAALFVDKILKGASPAELPVEQPTVIRLTLNLRTARSIGFRFPQDVLLRADRVIE